jgi:hypothetical protein
MDSTRIANLGADVKGDQSISPQSHHRLLLHEEEGQRLRVEIRQLQEFDDIDPSITGFTLGKRRVRHAHLCGNLSLREVCLLAGLNETPQKCVVRRLIRRRPCLSGFASFGGCSLLHLTSFGNP